MASNKYYVSAGLQMAKDTDNMYTGTNKYSMVAGLPKVAESEGGAGFVPYPYPRHELTGGLAK